jgi:hypothetical protein
MPLRILSPLKLTDVDPVVPLRAASIRGRRGCRPAISRTACRPLAALRARRIAIRSLARRRDGAHRDAATSGHHDSPQLARSSGAGRNPRVEITAEHSRAPVRDDPLSVSSRASAPAPAGDLLRSRMGGRRAAAECNSAYSPVRMYRRLERTRRGRRRRARYGLNPNARQRPRQHPLAAASSPLQPRQRGSCSRTRIGRAEAVFTGATRSSTGGFQGIQKPALSSAWYRGRRCGWRDSRVGASDGIIVCIMRSADRFFLGLGIAVVVGLLGTSAFNPDSGFLIHSYVLLANLRADVRDRLGAVVHRGDPRRRDQRVQTPPLAKLLTKTRLSRAAEPCEHAVWSGHTRRRKAPQSARAVLQCRPTGYEIPAAATGAGRAGAAVPDGRGSLPQRRTERCQILLSAQT